MKSHAKFHTLCKHVFKDVLAQCDTDEAELMRDLATIKSRVKHEGLSFLTITLPAFCQGIERSLEQGMVSHVDFLGWRFHKSLPMFLRGLTSLVFDLATGVILPDPDPVSLKLIRQLTNMFKKILVDCRADKVQQAFQDFKELEQSLESYEAPEGVEMFDKVSMLLWGNMFSDFNPDDMLPRHGPGATVERIYGNAKYVHRTWNERLQTHFPFDHYACFNYEHAEEVCPNVEFLDEESELPVRVTAVPKTQKGPRIIAIEPVCMQYTQQALSRYILPKIETHWITRGHVNFRDQTVNQRLAMESSTTKRLASLDLSSASDRVPLSMVTRMLKSTRLLPYALACRSGRADLQGEIIHLNKFASMGSALCFPVEAMYFFTIIIVAILRKHKTPVTLRNIYKTARSVYVYGDDLFVPTDEVEAVTETLTEYNCKVNTHKSFWRSNFRESCGQDAFNGVDVTPIYLRTMPPSNRNSVKEILSWISTSNQFYKAGYWHTSTYLKEYVERIYGRLLPIVLETSPSLGFVTYTGAFTVHRTNKHLHRPEVLGYVVCPVYRRDPVTGYNAMVKWTIDRCESVGLDYTKSSRSGTVRIQRRWTTPY